MGKKSIRVQDTVHPDGAEAQEDVSEETLHSNADEAVAIVVAEKKAAKKKDKKDKKSKKAKKSKKQKRPSTADEAEFEAGAAQETLLAEAVSEAAEEDSASPEEDRQVVVADRSWRRRLVPNWRRILLLFGVLVIAGVAVLLATRNSSDGSASAQPQVAADTQTATVERTTLYSTIDASGTIAGERTVNLAVGTSSTVLSVDVAVGDQVVKGQTLATLDITDLEEQVALAEQSLAVQQTSYDKLVAGPTESEVEEARASLETAQIQLDAAIANQETAQSQVTITCAGVDDAESALAEAQEAYNDYLQTGYALDATFIPDPDAQVAKALKNAQSNHDVELTQCENARASAADTSQIQTAQANVNKAQSALDTLLAGATEEELAQAEVQLEQARIQLEQARRKLADATLVAPFDGVVTAVNITEGGTASSGQAAITLVDTGQLHLDVVVDELDIAQVKVGQPVTVTIDAADATLEGVVARVDPSGTETQGIVTYGVRVDVTPDEGVNVILGMTADAEIKITADENVLVVPTGAIQRDATGNEFVMVQSDTGEPARVPVVTGNSSGGQTVVEGDLQEGQIVYVTASQTTSSNSTEGFPGGGGFMEGPIMPGDGGGLRPFGGG